MLEETTFTKWRFSIDTGQSLHNPKLVFVIGGYVSKEDVISYPRNFVIATILLQNISCHLCEAN